MEDFEITPDIGLSFAEIFEMEDNGSEYSEH